MSIKAAGPYAASNPQTIFDVKKIAQLKNQKLCRDLRDSKKKIQSQTR
ncbi:MAG: hypothetical protein IBX40_02165 [Methanosarcinales archaeon]|nr:hypothetical protein [Methanosarcinales archaeon]